MESTPIESFADVRTLIEDLFQVRPIIYWLDFLGTTALGWSAYAVAVHTFYGHVGWSVAALVVAALAFYRALIFVHEITHVRTSALLLFTIAWNTLCGLFLFIPSYTYLCHASHHRVTSFSTKGDPEYLPLSYQKPFQLLSPFLIFPLLPLVLAFRFLVLGPLSILVGGRCREWVLRHASSLKLNLAYEWITITAEERTLAKRMDLLCLVWWVVFIGVCSGQGILAAALATWAILVYVIQCINHFRSLVAHRYINGTGARVSYEAQLLDSITITEFSPAAELLTPIGLRYHSLHHMFPTMPYHALGAAHRRLAQRLPQDHLYFKTLMPTFFACVRQFFRTAGRSVPAPESPSGPTPSSTL